jgi:hypothetical protein
MVVKLPVTPDLEEAALKPTSLLPLAVLLLTMLPPVMPAQIHFTATLNGGQEVPPVVIPATGSASFELSGDLTELRYYVSYQGMTAGDGGLHEGGTGANGALIRSLATPASASGTFSGVWRNVDAEPLTPAFVDSLLTGRMYIELNNADRVAGGGMRGQLVLSTSLHFEAVCDGAQENPPVPTTAGGTGVFVLDKTRTRLDYWLTYRGLTGTLSSGGEIRVGTAGSGGPVVHTIASAGAPPSSTIKGTWESTDVQPLTGALVDSLVAGRLYSNFSTGANQGGEIRGQIVLKAGIGFVASLDSAQENPATPTHASGTGSFVLNDARDQLTYNLTYIGLSGDIAGGSHIHLGRVAHAGVIVKTIASDGGTPEGTISGIWRPTELAEKFTPALAESLITGKLYTDIHTSSNSGGEIRGQINLTTGAGFTSQLSAKENVPPSVLSNGTGTASITLSPDRQRVTYSLTYLDITDGISSAGGHFHTGARGLNGELVKLIVPPNAPDAYTVVGEWSTSDAGSQPLTPAVVDSLVSGHIYINLHTGAYIGGEIRGQVSRDFDVLTSIRELSPMAPGEFRLEQNYPNPFNPGTIIRFQLNHASNVDLAIYNALGQKVATLYHGEKAAGEFAVTFNASDIGSGVYFCRLQAGGLVQTTKLLHVK